MRFDPPYNLIVITGPTASGKTKLAVALANELDTEIISADSRQVYREMNLGTGKDLDEYIIDGKIIKHHLIDLVEAGSSYHINQYIHDFFEAFHPFQEIGRVPVLCGGSGMYIDALLRGYEYTSIPVNEELRSSLAEKTKDELKTIFGALPPNSFTPIADTSTSKRLLRAIEIGTFLIKNKPIPKNYPAIHPVVFGLNLSPAMRRERIEQRLHYRLQNGLIEEVKLLLNKIPSETLIRYGLEYKFVTQHLLGDLSYEEMQLRLTIAIQQFAKRQMTWFRKMEREGLRINRIDVSLTPSEQLSLCLEQVR